MMPSCAGHHSQIRDLKIRTVEMAKVALSHQKLSLRNSKGLVGYGLPEAASVQGGKAACHHKGDDAENAVAAGAQDQQQDYRHMRPRWAPCLTFHRYHTGTSRSPHACVPYKSTDLVITYQGQMIMQKHAWTLDKTVQDS